MRHLKLEAPELQTLRQIMSYIIVIVSDAHLV